jgi:hypothetical protein
MKIGVVVTRLQDVILSHLVASLLLAFVIIGAVFLTHFLSTGYPDNIVLGKDYIDPTSVQAAAIQVTPECIAKQANTQKEVAPLEAQASKIGGFLGTAPLPVLNKGNTFSTLYAKYQALNNQINQIEIQNQC